MVERQLFLLSSSAQADDPAIPILAIARQWILDARVRGHDELS
jgi:hypothetical protein